MALTQVTSSMLEPTAQYMGYKNRIINGAMKIWQRGTSISVGGSDTYTADRWFGLAAGANFTASQASYSLGGITKASLVISGAASNTRCDMAQRIEAANAYDLAGSVCTVSADIYTTDGTSVTWEAYSANAADNFSATTLIATGTLTTTAGSYTSKTFSFTASSAVANGLEIRFKFGALLAGKQGALGGVQLEKGSTATSFDYRPYGTELLLCQRYFWLGYALANGVAWVYCDQTDSSGPLILFPQMRTNPTMTIVAAPTYNACTSFDISYTGSGIGGAVHRISPSPAGARAMRAYGGVYSAYAEL